ncbi:MAG: glycine/sarcosine/betaine reductase selenoprotein B family protein [Thiotrichales bacterium]|nr:glycine/sarcosine/betaine reductase selenoprotein B family protein [Thiotrichales bacterium]
MSRPPVDYIERTAERYGALGYPPYQWVRNDDEPPFAPMAKPLAGSRIGLIASGGVYRVGQIAFHYRDDSSYRIIPRDCEMSELRATHFAYDLTSARSDPNVVFPLATLRAEAGDGGIGEVAPNAYTFMGGIYSARRVRERLAPALAERMEEDAVDAALLVPA